MNPFSPLILSLALLFGGAGAVFAFESASQADAPRSAAAATQGSSVVADATPASRPERRHHRRAVVRWAPCPAGSTLVESDNTCVTDVVKTVTLPAAPAAQAVSHTSGSAGATHSSGGDDHGEDHSDDHGGDDGGHGGGEHDD